MARPRAKLIELRNLRRLTQSQVARALDITTRSYARYESGETKVVPIGKRPRLAQRLDVSTTELAVVLRDGDDTPDAANGHAVPASLTLYVSLEQGASRLWAFQPWTVHALLQTPAYAAAVERLTPQPFSDETIAHRVEMRIARQAVLHRQPEPLQLCVLLDESVLLRVTGGYETMAGQLTHLAEMADLPTVDVRVLPLAAGLHPASLGGFMLLASLGADTAQMVCISDRTGIRYLEGVEAVGTHIEVFDHIYDNSLTAEASVDLIHSTAKERYL